MADESFTKGQMNTSPASTDEAWKCRFCGEHFVVPQLARDHERKCPYKYELGL